MRNRRWIGAALAVLLLAGSSAAVLAADESPAPGPPEHARERGNKGDKEDKTPGIEVTVTGSIAATTDGQGRAEYTLTAGGTTWTVSTGPKWWFGSDSPLAKYVGKSVTVVGTHREGSTELDATSVDGQALRAEGRPPWAGGPRAVGESHPGWKPWFAGAKVGLGLGRGLGREHAPGQSKDDATPG